MRFEPAMLGTSVAYTANSDDTPPPGHIVRLLVSVELQVVRTMPQCGNQCGRTLSQQTVQVLVRLEAILFGKIAESLNKEPWHSAP